MALQTNDLEVEQVLNQVRPRLEEAFGPRLRGILLYGSFARGDQEPDSDLDLMVLLEPPVDLGRDLWTIVNALYPLQLQIPEHGIHGFPVSIESFDAGHFSLYRHARAEGIAL